ncbi:hypothetical protein FA95DRAFT_1602792 [Auriscalpium vulgare]|uniref:Uncharacterized protein n=1 Tax=Auriscalpium vulgare TaxID=40419 RepID=A0ACB8S6E2_9AGAM|nr:hypothetical protein FA95DRAFT_1602792 [Auriscalpium vulgare]
MEYLDIVLQTRRLPQEEPATSQPTQPRPVSTPQLTPSLPSGHSSAQQERKTVPMSTTFFPSANLDTLPPNLTICSQDGVLFYVHRPKILGASSNRFAAHVPAQETTSPPAVVSVPLESSVLNILFHVIYTLPVVHYSPSPDIVLAAIGSLQAYGLASDAYLVPGAPLFELAVVIAPQAPMQFYSVAAMLDVHSLAVVVSSQLLSYQLHDMTEDVALQVGSVYLNRLFLLHIGRIAAFKRLLVKPPRLHEVSQMCDLHDQRNLTRAWSLAVSYLSWDSKADTSTSTIEDMLRPLGDHLTCPQCRVILRERILDLVFDWSRVKDTI